MTRYFYSIERERGVPHDVQSIELPDCESARNHALDVLRLVLRRVQREGGTCSQVTLRVSVEGGEDVCTLSAELGARSVRPFLRSAA